MTTVETRPAAAQAQSWHPRAEAELLRDQLTGIQAWTRARHAYEAAMSASDSLARSREARLDFSRRTDVIRRQHEALINRTAEQMRQSRQLLGPRSTARAVLVHRNEWFKEKVTDGLRGYGIEVVARLENGADAVGVVVAEQPDLLLVEDRLPMIGGLEVLREVARYAPRTLTAAQVEYDASIGEVLHAGARTAFTRRVPPADVAHDLHLLVSA